jgi:hypothetical protein
MRRQRLVPLLLALLTLSACLLPVPATTPTETPPPTNPPTGTVPPPTATVPDLTPGVIAGMVDMRSAPPYLNDPIVTGGLGIPVVVVAFNLDDGTWRWFDTTPTHPNYELTVPPGDYRLVAYGMGVADIPYVSGGYTGQNPSCGLELLTVTVGPNQRVTGIDIADWNWTCLGTAYRPAKPDEVPIP